MNLYSSGIGIVAPFFGHSYRLGLLSSIRASAKRLRVLRRSKNRCFRRALPTLWNLDFLLCSIFFLSPTR
jgi:hypothetical protein